MTALRVVTWNIRAAIGPGPFPDRWWRRIDADRLRAIGAFLSGLDADVIALQEIAIVSRDGLLVDNAGDLARQLGLEVRYGAVRTFDVVEDGRTVGAGLFGNALLARQPLRDVRAVALPAAPADSVIDPPGAVHPVTREALATAGIRYADAPASIREPRTLLLASVVGIRIGTAHFSHRGSGERRLQAEAAVEAFGEAAPALFLGDLNASVETPELEPFAAWQEGFTVPPGHPERVTTDDGFRIDHVLVRGGSIVRLEVLRESGDLSDHYPVIAAVGW